MLIIGVEEEEEIVNQYVDAHVDWQGIVLDWRRKAGKVETLRALGLVCLVLVRTLVN